MLINYFNDLNNYELGIDEAGRGPLIGRVYAGAVCWDSSKEPSKLITDSKKLTSKKRKLALEWIKSNVKAWGVGYAESNEIDDINILQATNLAMTRAIDNLKQNVPLDKPIKYLIVDGIGWEYKFKDYNVKSVVKGDSLYYSIAAASIIAKEYHDDYIIDLCRINPELDTKYSLLSNKGYGTKKHMEGIAQYGPSNYHRKSFAPIKNYI